MNIKLILEIDGHQYKLDQSDDTRYDFVIDKDVQVFHISTTGNQIGFVIKAKKASGESEVVK